MAEDLEQQIDAWAKQLLSRLSPAAQRKLARKVGVALRRANAKRIRANKAPNGQSWPARKEPAPRYRKQADHSPMYDKMAKAKYLKIKVYRGNLTLGFFGRVARIAQVAQYGLYDNVVQGVRVEYATRPLLGFSHADIEMIRDLLAEQLGGH